MYGMYNIFSDSQLSISLKSTKHSKRTLSKPKENKKQMQET